MTEAQLTNREKEMLAGTLEEKIIYRLKCVHHKVCGYMCTQVCPYRDTAKSEAVLDEIAKRLRNELVVRDDECDELVLTIGDMECCFAEYREELRQQQKER